MNDYVCKIASLEDIINIYDYKIEHEPEELRNKEIYKHYGFTEHIKDGIEVNPDGSTMNIEYYRKKL